MATAVVRVIPNYKRNVRRRWRKERARGMIGRLNLPPFQQPLASQDFFNFNRLPTICGMTDGIGCFVFLPRSPVCHLRSDGEDGRTRQALLSPFPIFSDSAVARQVEVCSELELKLKCCTLRLHILAGSTQGKLRKCETRRHVAVHLSKSRFARDNPLRMCPTK